MARRRLPRAWLRVEQPQFWGPLHSECGLNQRTIAPFLLLSYGFAILPWAQGENYECFATVRLERCLMLFVFFIGRSRDMGMSFVREPLFGWFYEEHKKGSHHFWGPVKNEKATPPHQRQANEGKAQRFNPWTMRRATWMGILSSADVGRWAADLDVRGGAWIPRSYGGFAQAAGFLRCFLLSCW